MLTFHNFSILTNPYFSGCQLLPERDSISFPVSPAENQMRLLKENLFLT